MHITIPLCFSSLSLSLSRSQLLQNILFLSMMNIRFISIPIKSIFTYSCFSASMKYQGKKNLFVHVSRRKNNAVTSASQRRTVIS